MSRGHPCRPSQQAHQLLTICDIEVQKGPKMPPPIALGGIYWCAVLPAAPIGGHLVNALPSRNKNFQVNPYKPIIVAVETKPFENSTS